MKVVEDGRTFASLGTRCDTSGAFRGATVIGLITLSAMQIGSASATGVEQAPRFLNPEPISVQDYPRASLLAGEYGIVSVVLQISPEGKVGSCKITETSGHLELDERTCVLLTTKARFSAARDRDGSRIASEYRTATNWVLNQHRPVTTMDVQLYVSQVPTDYHAPVNARLIFDAGGHVESCEVRVSSGSQASDRAACAYAEKTLTTSPPKSGSADVPAAAVRYMTASLSLQPTDTPSQK